MTTAPVVLNGAQNIIVVQSNNSVTSGANTFSVVTGGQFQLALAANSLNEQVYQALSADKNDTNWIRYDRCLSVTLGDALSLAVQSIIGYTNDQMSALFLQASVLTP